MGEEDKIMKAIIDEVKNTGYPLSYCIRLGQGKYYTKAHNSWKKDI